MDDLTKELKKCNGFQERFLDRIVRLPKFSKSLKKQIAPVDKTFATDNVLRYQNYSVVQHKERRFPIFSAANIDGDKLKEIPRKTLKSKWQLDPRLKNEYQWGQKLYSAKADDFDRGHMTKREDVQWADKKADAKLGAELTFFFTNSVPQVLKLNQRVWRALESHILNKIWKEKVEKKKKKNPNISDLVRKISMFTGPVLSNLDPIFVEKVQGKEVKIPTVFWKVIYYTSKRGTLYRLGFLMGQDDELKRKKIVTPSPSPKGGLGDDDDEEQNPAEVFFNQFKKMPACQVPVSMIESLTGLTFSRGKEPASVTQQKTSFLDIKDLVQAKGGLGDDDDEEEVEEADSNIDGLILEF